MKRSTLSVLSFATVLCLSTAALSADKMPNLKPGFNTATGTVQAKNTGNAIAGKSVLTIKCAAMHGGSCPDPTPAQMADYTLPGYADMGAINVPKVGPSKTFSHKIKFFNDLNFAPGKYIFTVCVDAGKTVRESNENDNCKRFSMVKKSAPKRPHKLKPAQ
ncbi:MAG: CARDB domain-containing protein [Sneathiella sp.]